MIYYGRLHRSYLHGSVGPFQSLLGNSELKRTLCDGQLDVFIGTWNMNGKVRVHQSLTHPTQPPPNSPAITACQQRRAEHEEKSTTTEKFHQNSYLKLDIRPW